MKIYFCGSIRAGRLDASLYAKIIAKLSSFGCVLTEHIGWESPDKVLPEDKRSANNTERDVAIHETDMNWLKECDCVVAECTQPSLGVGYEIGRAVAMKKPILCLFRPNDARCNLSAMIRGAQDSCSLVVEDYSDIDQLDELFVHFIKKQENNN